MSWRRRPTVPKSRRRRRETEELVVSEEESGSKYLGIDSDRGSVKEDDCPVYTEDNVGYFEIVEELELGGEFVEVHIGDDEGREGNSSGDDEAGVDNVNGDDDDDDDDDDIRHDVWEEEKVLDPLSESDNEDGEEFRFVEDPEKILQLGKTFNNVEQFKYALLMYSLKSQYNTEFYKSSADKLGAKCTKSFEEKCPWSCYCSFEKGKN